MAEQSGKRLGRGTDAAILVAGQLAIGSAALLTRLGLDAGMGPWAMAAWRLSLASVLLLPVLNARPRAGSAAPIPFRTRLLLCGAGACLALHFSSWFASLRHVGVGLSTLLVSTSPIWAGLAEVLFVRRPPRPAFWVGLAVAFVGLFGVSFASRGTARGSLATGCALATAGAVFLAAYMMLTRDSQARWGTWRTVSWTYSAAAVCLIPAATLAEGAAHLTPPNTTAWIAVVGMALVPQLVGHTTLNYALQRFSAGVVGVATLMEPVFAAALAWPAFGEPITGAQASGAAVLLVGVAIVLTRGQGEPA